MQRKPEAQHTIAGDGPIVACAIPELRWHPNDPLVAWAHQAERLREARHKASCLPGLYEVSVDAGHPSPASDRPAPCAPVRGHRR